MVKAWQKFFKVIWELWWGTVDYRNIIRSIIYCNLTISGISIISIIQTVILYNKYRPLLVLCYLSGVPSLDCIPCLKYLFHDLILKCQDMLLKNISNRNGELHYMLQVMKPFCDRDLLGYSHSNGKMKSAQLQLFFCTGFILMSLCCHKEWENNFAERENILLSLKNRKVMNWSLWLDV